MLKLPGQWVWDSWYLRHGDDFHAFYLQASRALGDPIRRHRNVTVGHAVSPDLKTWTVLPDALAPSESPAFDSWTTWTGSVIQVEESLWYLYYTGTSREDDGKRQSVGLAISSDLIHWEKHSQQPLVAADPRWYMTLQGGYDLEPFRDPWVFRLPGEDEWTMLVTAGSPSAKDPRQAGVMGIAKSDDLINWEVREPLGAPDSGFGETEVFQYAVVDGVPLLLFCCGPLWLSEERLARGERGGVYSLPVSPDLSDVDFSRSVLFDDTTLYASRLVQDAAGGWQLLAFVDHVAGEFVGEICDPIPVTADPKLGLIRIG